MTLSKENKAKLTNLQAEYKSNFYNELNQNADKIISNNPDKTVEKLVLLLKENGVCVDSLDEDRSGSLLTGAQRCTITLCISTLDDLSDDFIGTFRDTVGRVFGSYSSESVRLGPAVKVTGDQFTTMYDYSRGPAYHVGTTHKYTFKVSKRFDPLTASTVTATLLERLLNAFSNHALR